jgi:hypothetical protein
MNPAVCRVVRLLLTACGELGGSACASQAATEEEKRKEIMTVCSYFSEFHHISTLLIHILHPGKYECHKEFFKSAAAF